jgi:hypothetical protein
MPYLTDIDRSFSLQFDMNNIEEGHLKISSGSGSVDDGKEVDISGAVVTLPSFEITREALPLIEKTVKSDSRKKVVIDGNLEVTQNLTIRDESLLQKMYNFEERLNKLERTLQREKKEQSTQTEDKKSWFW